MTPEQQGRAAYRRGLNSSPPDNLTPAQRDQWLAGWWDEKDRLYDA